MQDKEMEAAIAVYVDYVRAHKHHAELEGIDQSGAEVLIEVRLISRFVPDHGGTIDCLIVGRDSIHAIDFKYGVMPVDAENNKQLLSYLVLAAEKYPDRKRFFGSIVQPRVLGRPQCVEYTASQLACHQCDVLMSADDDAKEAGEHCRWCPLRQTCKVLDKKNEEFAKDIFDDGWNAVKCLDVIAMAKVMKSLAADAKDHLRKLMLGGEQVEGYRLAVSLANRCWVNEEEAIAKFQSWGIKDEALQIIKFKSPTQLTKTLADSFSPKIDTLTHRPERGVIVVENSSKLPEYDPAGIFEVIE